MQKLLLIVVALVLVGCGTPIPLAENFPSNGEDDSNYIIEGYARDKIERTYVRDKDGRRIGDRTYRVGAEIDGYEAALVEELYINKPYKRHWFGTWPNQFTPDFTNRKLTHAKDLKYFTYLEDLTIRYSDLENLEGLQNLIRLKNLSLMSNKIKSVKPLGTTKLRSLESLTIHYNPIENLDGLEKLPKLKTLWISLSPDSGSKITKEMLNGFMKRRPDVNVVVHPDPETRD